MRKRIHIWFMAFVGMTILLSACGDKSQEKVVKDLENTLSDMTGYEANAEMTMRTGMEDQSFSIQILHQAPDLYRVSLASPSDEHSNQVILKNEDGVFVLTPALEKSFKFQTDWPDNSSQPYLFASLVSDILNDEEAEFETTDSHYIFRTKTHYQSNRNLPNQNIYLNKKTYEPELVEVLDNDRETVVEVSFMSFTWDPEFQEGDFTVEENMTTSADTPDSGQEHSTDFPVYYPLETLDAELIDKREVSFDDGERVIMTFAGNKNYTLIQEKVETVPTIFSPKEISGDLVNLGFAVGALSDQMIQWNFNGVDFYLASDGLTAEELIQIAQSVQGREAK